MLLYFQKIFVSHFLWWNDNVDLTFNNREFLMYDLCRKIYLRSWRWRVHSLRTSTSWTQSLFCCKHHIVVFASIIDCFLIFETFSTSNKAFDACVRKNATSSNCHLYVVKESTKKIDEKNEKVKNCSWLYRNNNRSCLIDDHEFEKIICWFSWARWLIKEINEEVIAKNKWIDFSNERVNKFSHRNWNRWCFVVDFKCHNCWRDFDRVNERWLNQFVEFLEIIWELD